MPAHPPTGKPSPFARTTPHRTPATGISLIFNGWTLTDLTSLTINFGQAEPYEIVTLNAHVRGTGAAAVPLTRYMAGKATPGTVTASGLGQWFDEGNPGGYGILYIGCTGLPNKQFKAFLAKSELVAQVNDLWRVNATWQLMDWFG